jgi:hypothetical protein
MGRCGYGDGKASAGSIRTRRLMPLTPGKPDDVIFRGFVIDQDFDTACTLCKGVLGAQDRLGTGKPDAVNGDLGHV